MEFNEKLQELRKQKGLTQEELAERLFVSRTAVSKWESGRGYPNIDSLKAIAGFFSVTVDQLLSSEELLTAAEDSQKQTVGRLRDLWFGLTDLCMALLLFLPLFATETDGGVQTASLLTMTGAEVYLTATYYAVVAGAILTGILTLALQGLAVTAWVKTKTVLSLSIGVVAVLLFIITRQPYAATLAFCLLAVKTVTVMKHP
jgi:transcriptional regulator with XRE-family HTH domain